MPPRCKWSKSVNLQLSKLEREIFLAGYQKVFLLFMDSCAICTDCAKQRELCVHPKTARPSPESLGVDVYTTVRQVGFRIQVKATYEEAMDRYAFLMIE